MDNMDAYNTVPANSKTETPLRVAIVGGGIGGLALATFLSTSIRQETPKLEVSIYESAPSLTELGAGVGVWLRTWKLLSSAGLAEDLKGIAPEGRDFSDKLQKAFEFRRGDRSPEGQSFYSMEVPFGVLALHRAKFQHVLAKHAIPPAQPHFGKRLVSYEYVDENDSSSEIVLKFTDGSTARADLLVGADGIRSAVRRELIHRFVSRGELKLEPNSESRETDADAISNLVDPLWSGTIAYRSLIPLEKLEARLPGHRAGSRPLVYFGKNRHIIAYPILASRADSTSNSQAHESSRLTPTQVQTPTQAPATMRTVNLVVFVSDPSREGTRLPPGEAWVRPAPREEVLKMFRGWEEEVIALIELAENPLAWAIHTVKPLQRYSDPGGRVVLLGDAAHAMTPHQGAGGGQAIEDAHVLASLLSHPLVSPSTLPNALRAYDAVRVPISQRVVRTSRENGMMNEFNSAWSEDPEKGNETERLEKLSDAIMSIFKWQWEDVDERRQVNEAVTIFEGSLKANDA